MGCWEGFGVAGQLGYSTEILLCLRAAAAAAGQRSIKGEGLSSGVSSVVMVTDPPQLSLLWWVVMALPALCKAEAEGCHSSQLSSLRRSNLYIYIPIAGIKGAHHHAQFCQVFLSNVQGKSHLR